MQIIILKHNCWKSEKKIIYLAPKFKIIYSGIPTGQMLSSGSAPNFRGEGIFLKIGGGGSMGFGLSPNKNLGVKHKEITLNDRYNIPSEHKMTFLHFFTFLRRCINVIQMFCACWTPHRSWGNLVSEKGRHDPLNLPLEPPSGSATELLFCIFQEQYLSPELLAAT